MGALIHFFPPNFVRVTNFSGVRWCNVKEIGIDRQHALVVQVRYIESCLWSLGSSCTLSHSHLHLGTASQLLSRQTKGEGATE